MHRGGVLVPTLDDGVSCEVGLANDEKCCYNENDLKTRGANCDKLPCKFFEKRAFYSNSETIRSQNSEFIALIADRLQLQMKRKHA